MAPASVKSRTTARGKTNGRRLCIRIFRVFVSGFLETLHQDFLRLCIRIPRTGASAPEKAEPRMRKHVDDQAQNVKMLTQSCKHH